MSSGRRKLCSDECQRQRERQHHQKWYASISDERRRVENRDSRVTKYGLTIERWEALLAEQGGACAVCGTSDPGGQWHTDHCHSTGRVRGILCGGCNMGLGQFCDNPERLRAAASYLERAAQGSPAVAAPMVTAAAEEPLTPRQMAERRRAMWLAAQRRG